jgi:hypothetical protein
MATAETTEWAEFRIFMPLLNPSDTEWLGAEKVATYQRLLDTALASIGYSASTCSDTRSDEYIVGKPYYGLKYRGGKKLEIKVRRGDCSPQNFCVETWEKFRVKSTGSQRTADISRVLTDFNYPETDYSRYLSEIDKDGSSVKVYKQITKSSCMSCVFEVSTLRVDDRSWVTVCLEGSKADLLECLGSTVRLQWPEFWTSLLAVIDEFSDVLGDATSRRCVPLIGGYPLWVNLCGGQMTVEDARIHASNARQVVARIVG